MDERNIDRIEQLRHSGKQEIYTAIKGEVEKEFKDREAIENHKSTLEKLIVDESLNVRSFMCTELGRLSHLMYGLGISLPAINAPSRDHKSGRFTLESMMFDKIDDLNSFTRSGWTFALSGWAPFVDSGHDKRLEYHKSPLFIFRKTVSLDDPAISSEECWFKISLGDDLPHKLHKKKIEILIKEVLEHMELTHHGVVKSYGFFELDAANKQHVNPDSEQSMLEKCFSIIQTGIKELGI